MGVSEKNLGKKLGFDYVANKKAWMMCDLFFDWLQNFHTYISKTPNRNVLLLIDKYSAHRISADLPTSLNVEMVFCPLAANQKFSQ